MDKWGKRVPRPHMGLKRYVRQCTCEKQLERTRRMLAILLVSNAPTAMTQLQSSFTSCITTVHVIFSHKYLCYLTQL